MSEIVVALTRELARLRAQGGGRRLLVAVSGGVDSMVLLDALAGLPASSPSSGSETTGPLPGVERPTLVVGHVDHAARATSADDAAFVRLQAQERGVPVQVQRLQGPPRRSEAELREGRYQALLAMRDQVGADRIVLAHTRDDQVETLLLRLLRGTGPRGAAAMSVDGRGLWRPLLGVPRAAVVAHARERGLPWREDPTNADRRYTRNRLRLDVLPTLRAAFPGADEALARFARVAGEERVAREALGRLLMATLGSTEGLDLERVPQDLRPDLALLLPDLLGTSGEGLSARHYDALADLLASPVAGSRSLDLPRARVVREYDRVRAEPARGRRTARPPQLASVTISGPGTWHTPFGVFVVSEGSGAGREDAGAEVACFEPASAPFPYQVRAPLPGDRVRPVGARGGRKLSDWWTDARVPRALRPTLALVCVADQIAWVPGWVRARVALPVDVGGDLRPRGMAPARIGLKSGN